MLKTFAVTIVFATFAWTAAASTSAQNLRPAPAAVKNLQLAQQGGVYCRKGYRYDYRQKTCVPQ